MNDSTCYHHSWSEAGPFKRQAICKWYNLSSEEEGEYVARRSLHCESKRANEQTSKQVIINRQSSASPYSYSQQHILEYANTMYLGVPEA
jgi:hypothetical protein